MVRGKKSVWGNLFVSFILLLRSSFRMLRSLLLLSLSAVVLGFAPSGRAPVVFGTRAVSLKT